VRANAHMASNNDTKLPNGIASFQPDRFLLGAWVETMKRVRLGFLWIGFCTVAITGCTLPAITANYEDNRGSAAGRATGSGGVTSTTDAGGGSGTASNQAGNGGTAPGQVGTSGIAPNQAGTTSNGGATGAAGASTARGGSPSTAGSASTVGSTNCTINSVLWNNGDHNPANACQVCQTAVTTAAWLPLAEGAACANGQVCHAGTCQPGCGISGKYHAVDEVNTDNRCQSCQPTVSASQWSPTSEGTNCAGEKVCHSGDCQSGCWIGGAFYAANAVIGGGLCWACKPAVSTAAWTADADSCSCTGGLQTFQAETGLCVAKLVPVLGPSTALNYSIDATEVTRVQYATWLATTSDATLGAQDPANCGWNSSFKPGADWYDPGAMGARPVAYVDWCDAYAYCAGVGKRLCGKIGGGSNLWTDYADPSASQWFNACSSGGVNTYTFGSTYDPAACNGLDLGKGGTTVAASLTGCQSPVAGFVGVYDLTGSLSEWEDSCSGVGVVGACAIRGGAYIDGAKPLVCGTHYSNLRSGDYGGLATTGFRCCSK